MTEEKTKEIKEGFCHACGKEVDKLICICYECVHKGVSHKDFPKCKVEIEA